VIIFILIRKTIQFVKNVHANLKMPSGRHNNHRGGRPKGKCSCTSNIKCRVCISRDWYKKHKRKHNARNTLRYWSNKARAENELSDSKLEDKLITRFKEKGWD
jgi:hypothetical protein